MHTIADRITEFLSLLNSNDIYHSFDRNLKTFLAVSGLFLIFYLGKWVWGLMKEVTYVVTRSNSCSLDFPRIFQKNLFKEFNDEKASFANGGRP